MTYLQLRQQETEMGVILDKNKTKQTNKKPH